MFTGSEVELNNNDYSRSEHGLSARSAYKSLEQVLYHISHHLKGPVQILLSESESLNNTCRFNVTDIKESLDNLEFLLKTTLKDKAKVADGDFSGADKDLFDKVQVETVLRALATTTSSSEHDEFYKFCVKTMADLYKCQYAFIGKLKPDGENVETLAVWAGHEFAENFEYNLAGTPCADIITFNKELIPTGASQLYAEDEILVQMGVDSYFGAPILNKDKGVIGLISVMDTKPMHPTEWTAPILGVFASRLALEIERKQALLELTEINETLEARIKERTRALEMMNEELSAFSYSVSHDLRTPIRTIVSFVQVLYEDHVGEFSGDATSILKRIEKAGQRLDKLTTDMLSLSRISSSELSIKKINLSYLAEEIINTLHDAEPERKLEFSVAPNLFAWSDEGLIKIALENILGNAWKYTQKNEIAEIKFGLLEGEETPTYFIKDNGVGFDEAFIEKIFLPFERLHSEKEFEGSGIGLATTLRIINRHGGKLWAESSDDSGASFYFNLAVNQCGQTRMALS